ncbi:hypothetical protein Tco_0303996 [Tanacetum coccineum]
MALQSYTAEFEKKAQAEKDNYIGLIENSIKDIINDEVKSQLPQIPPKEVSDYATLMIQSTITKSLKNVMLAKSASQPQSTHKAADRDYKDQDEDPLAGSDQGLKKRKMSKDAEPSKGSKSKESKSTSSSKGTKPYKPLPLIEDRGRQVVPTDYFINNDLEYLKGGSSSRKYMTSTTRTKVAKYDNIEGIEDMVPTL